MSLIQKFAIIASILVGPLMFCWEEAQAADNSKTPAKVDVITICYAAADLCFRTCQLAAGSGNANCDQGCERSLAACLPKRNKANIGGSGNSKNEVRKNRKSFSPN